MTEASGQTILVAMQELAPDQPVRSRSALLQGRWGQPQANMWSSDAGIVESCTIISQPAGAPLNGYHDRAPVVLVAQHWARWLDPAAEVMELLGPESVDRFVIHPASL